MGNLSKRELLKAKHIIDRFFVESGHELTVNGLFVESWDGHWAKQKTKWSDEVKKLYFKNIKPEFGDLEISKLTPRLIRSWHSKFKDKKTTGNRCLAVLSRMFTYGEENDLVALGHNPCRVVKPFPERKRKRFGEKEELIKIIEVLNSDFEKKRKPVTFIFLLLYTGSRPSVFVNAKWEHLKEAEKDGETFGILELSGKSTSKTGEDEVVVIPPQGMKLLVGLSRERLDGKILGIPIPHSYWRSVVERVGCEGLWLRDLRRTFATIGMSSGESVDVIGEILNHKCHETTKIYAKLVDEKRIESVGSIANTIEELV